MILSYFYVFAARCRFMFLVLFFSLVFVFCILYFLMFVDFFFFIINCFYSNVSCREGAPCAISQPVRLDLIVPCFVLSKLYVFM